MPFVARVSEKQLPGSKEWKLTADGHAGNNFIPNTFPTRWEEQVISTSVCTPILTLDASKCIFGNLLPKYIKKCCCHIYIFRYQVVQNDLFCIQGSLFNLWESGERYRKSRTSTATYGINHEGKIESGNAHLMLIQISRTA